MRAERRRVDENRRKVRSFLLLVWSMVVGGRAGVMRAERRWVDEKRRQKEEEVPKFLKRRRKCEAGKDSGLALLVDARRLARILLKKLSAHQLSPRSVGEPPPTPK